MLMRTGPVAARGADPASGRRLRASRKRGRTESRRLGPEGQELPPEEHQQVSEGEPDQSV